MERITVLGNKMNVASIVVIGSTTSDRTQFVKSACGNSLHSGDKMDYCQIVIDADLSLNLFATFRQKKFNFMWEILSENVLGFVVFCESLGSESLDETTKTLNDLQTYAPSSSVVIAVPSQEMMPGVQTIAGGMPVISCNITDSASVRTVLRTLLKSRPQDTLVDRIIDKLS